MIRAGLGVSLRMAWYVLSWWHVYSFKCEAEGRRGHKHSHSQPALLSSTSNPSSLLA